METFFDRYKIAGRPQDYRTIDSLLFDMIIEWRNTDRKITKAKYLGFTDLEYRIWIENPRFIMELLKDRNLLDNYNQNR